MKALLALIALTIGLEASATHLNQYFVYHEASYVQGSWRRANTVDAHGSRYLMAEAYEDYFGTVRIEFVERLLFRLSEYHPEHYTWAYAVSIQGDTVVLKPQAHVPALETVQNEITATMVLNNFGAVRFEFPGNEETWTLEHLSLPYVDLVSPGCLVAGEPVKDPYKSDVLTPPTAEGAEESRHSRRNPLMGWLFASGVLNVGLLAFRLRQKAQP